MKRTFIAILSRLRRKFREDPAKLALLALIYLIFLARVPLISGGHSYFTDEQRYRHVFTFMDKLSEGKVKESVSYLFRSYCRSGFMVMAVIPAIGQRIMDSDVGRTVYAGDETFKSYQTYDIASLLINALCVTIVCLYFYKILFLLTQNKTLSIAGTLIFSSLNSNFMYIRHLAPYYMGMLFYLAALDGVIEKKPTRGITNKAIIKYGLLTGFAFCVYPGYFQFVFVIAALIFFLTRRKIHPVLLFGFTFMAVLAGVEIISQIGGISNLFAPYQMKAVYVESGDPPGISLSQFTAAFHYMGGTEGIIGVILLGVFLLFCAFYLPKREFDIRTKVIILSSIIIYFSSSIFSCFFKVIHKNTYAFYFYTTIISLGAMIALNQLKKHKKAAVLALCALSLLSFLYYYNKYSKLTYPLDMRYEMQRKFPGKKIMYTAEFHNKSLQRMALYIALRDKYDFLAVNVSTLTSSLGPPGGPIDLGKENLVMSAPSIYSAFPPYAADALGWLNNAGKPADEMRIYKLKG